MTNNIDLALELANEMNISQDDFLATAVELLYGKGDLEQAKKVISLSDNISLFSLCFERLAKERMKNLLLDQPHAQNILSAEAKCFIDEGFESREAKPCKIAEPETAELFQQQCQIIYNLLKQLKKSLGDGEDQCVIDELIQICEEMKNPTFAWYEESLEMGSNS
eukprot:CAMPEP_0116997650 /NCGR_PEP_ID=MMETSP0472-20121206/1013_1 /TAXON_ID=693140 ORGANISM="Tiarina fusus, Strain LIS" /NCGR_SAMPLE_ID=MMETSP0472 /ASSEMBLY_ACC=CAM_ASM_000603 /LENGTH=164 /DNA_ID=CAMNT_0004696597 /DNA_START=494 /DNA_END=984 /DNA_ORIENTATION=+